MARYGTEHKQATRQRIIETAGRRLKRDGIDGSGVATLMADAGLTNGAFYAHFPSKDDLVATALADQLREQRDSLSAVAPGRAGVEQYVREYLSVQHRDNPADGCPPIQFIKPRPDHLIHMKILRLRRQHPHYPPVPIRPPKYKPRPP
jgi:TetR/AcrR family transcriptional repressor of nem operon